MMAHDNKTTLDLTWDYTHDAGVPSDTHFVCDWSQVEPNTMQMPSCAAGTCTGHRKDDLLPMSNFADQGETYTNEEFFRYASPFNDDIPYVYDTFTDWPACADKGYTFWVDGFVWEGDDDGLFIIDGDGMFSDGKVSGAESSSGMS